MRITATMGILVLGLSLSGCASIIAGTTQTVNVSTTPASGANCTLQNKEGSWTMSSPGPIKVARSKTNLDVRCTQAGYQEASSSVPSDFEPWTLGNILIGGLIGLGIDWSTGAIHKYPDTIQVPMNQSSGALNQGNDGRPIS